MCRAGSHQPPQAAPVVLLVTLCRTTFLVSSAEARGAILRLNITTGSVGWLGATRSVDDPPTRATDREDDQ